MIAFAFGGLVAAALADVLTTRAGLRTGAFVEGNPLMRPFVRSTRSAIVAKAIGLAVIGWGVLELAPERPRVALVVALGAAAVNAWHAWGNWQLIRAWRGHEPSRQAIRNAAMNAPWTIPSSHAPFEMTAERHEALFLPIAERRAIILADETAPGLDAEQVAWLLRNRDRRADDLEELRRLAAAHGETLPTVDSVADRDYLDALEARRLAGCL